MARKISLYFLVLFVAVAWVKVPIAKLQQVQLEVNWTKQGLKWTDFQHVDIIPGSSAAIGKTTTKLYYTFIDTVCPSSQCLYWA